MLRVITILLSSPPRHPTWLVFVFLSLAHYRLFTLELLQHSQPINSLQAHLISFPQQLFKIFFSGKLSLQNPGTQMAQCLYYKLQALLISFKEGFLNISTISILGQKTLFVCGEGTYRVCCGVFTVTLDSTHQIPPIRQQLQPRMPLDIATCPQGSREVQNHTYLRNTCPDPYFSNHLC